MEYDGVSTGISMRIYCWVHSDRLNHNKLNQLIEDDICDDIFLLIVTSNFAFYKSNLYPYTSIQIPIPEIVEKLRNAGLHVHAWIVTLLKGDEIFSLKNIDLYHISKTGKSIVLNPPYYRSYRWLDPANPRTINFILDLVKEVLDVAQFDSIHLDYIRYPDNPPAPGVARYYGIVPKYEEERDYGYSSIAIKRFNEEFGLDARALKYDSIEYNVWMRWRANRVKHLVEAIKKLCRSVGAKIGADVFPTPELGYKHVLQKWDEWNLDLFAPMLYHEYWMKPPSWIIKTSLELQSRGLPIAPGIHLNQLKNEDIPYIVCNLLEEVKTLSVFVYPPATSIMEENWKVLKKVLKDMGLR